MSRYFSIEQLTDAVTATLLREHLTPEVAQILASRIVAAERDGTRSHGLMRVADYQASLRAGWINPQAQQQLLTRASPFVQVEGDNGFTQVAAALATEALLERVSNYGIALLSVRNAHHIGALWTDIEPYAAQGFVALNFVNSRPRLAPYGANRPLLGTNAMAFAFHDGEHGVVSWDQASSVMSLGEVKQHALRQQPLPPGVGLDRHGDPTTDAQAVLQGGTLLPFGEHKGSGIALMVEVMAAALTGASFGFEDKSANYPGAASSNAGQMLIVIDPAFSAATPFAPRIASLVKHMHSDPTLHLPGERRKVNRAAALQSGLLVSDDVAEQLGLG